MKFVITAGHGDSDPGAVANGHTESGLMLELRDILANKLRNYGHEVFTDGPPKQNKALAFALKLFNLAPICVELHCNAAVNAAANGVEVIALPKDKAKAQIIAQRVANVIGSKVRGDKGFIDQSQSARGRLGYINSGGMILETFFISNPDELASYNAKKWLVAEALALTLIEIG